MQFNGVAPIPPQRIEDGSQTEYRIAKPGEPLCDAIVNGFGCTKVLGHADPLHVAHGGERHGTEVYVCKTWR